VDKLATDLEEKLWERFAKERLPKVEMERKATSETMHRGTCCYGNCRATRLHAPKAARYKTKFRLVFPDHVETKMKNGREVRRMKNRLLLGGGMIEKKPPGPAGRKENVF
jgi:hypothetical protein